MSYFLIKHHSGRKYFHPYGGARNPSNETNVVLHEDIHDRMYWTFERTEDHWGYIKHVASGKFIHPQGGSLNPENETSLVLSSDRHFGALFALDQRDDHIIHKGGKVFFGLNISKMRDAVKSIENLVTLTGHARFAHPAGGSPNPGNDTKVVLHSDIHDAMRFKFVEIGNPNKEVMVYGSPIVQGKWKIINMVRNPLAEHTDTLQIKIGKSTTESTKMSFQYKWEASGGVNIEIFSASASQSVEFMIEKSSSSTWSEEVTRTRQIKVSPGNTVVTWQYVFDIKQNASESVFRSNLLADTESETTEPTDVNYKL